jgi:hypothetical protein
MIEQVFHVATEFRFDIGHALLSSQQLEGAVNKISDAADNALMSFQHLGAGLVAHLGLGSGGLLAILGKAVQISDKFNSSSLSFSNIISSNMKLFAGTIDTFNDRLDTSKMIMMDINKVANQFALPSNELLQMTKLVTPLLAQHGMAGTNFSGSINMAKNVLKSAPNLGINPQDSEGQLLRAISGQAGMHDTLFRRLMTETSAFKDNKITTSQQFNALPADKRIKLLDKSLQVFASDTDVLKNRVNSLSGQLTILTNNFSDFGSVLRPLGDALLKPVVYILQNINQFLDTDGRKIATSFGKLIENVFEDPKNLLINLMQLKNLGADTKKGASLMGIIEIVLLLRSLKNFAPLAGVGLAVSRGLGMVFSGLKSIVGLIPFMGIFRFVMQSLGFVLGTLLPRMFASVMLFQVLSRARAIAKITDAQAFITLSPQIADLFTRLKIALENIFMPIGMVIDAIAQFLAPAFELSNWLKLGVFLLDGIVTVLEGLGKASILALAGLNGIFFAIFQFMSNIASLKNPFAGVSAAFNAGVNDVLDRNANRLLDKGGAVVNQVTNIGKVEIRNDFKENQEPDRIAFTLKEQLLKAAKNPTQGRGSGSLQGAFAR